MTSLTEKLKTLIQPTVEALGFELWGVHYMGGNAPPVVQVFIEKTGGVTVDDCAKASHQISILLDVEMPNLGRYALELSSPGLDRQLFELDHYCRNLHKTLTIKLIEPIDGRRNFNGELMEVDEQGIVVLNVDGQTVRFPINKIHTARLKTDFEKKSR